MKKKGFTLIELLAVIIIIAIVALITIPVVSHLIDDSKKNTFSNSVTGMIKSIEMYSTKVAGTDIVLDLSPTGGDIGKIDFNGQDPEQGTAYINPDGKISIFMCNDEFCGYKRSTEKKIIIEDRDSTTSEQFLSLDVQEKINWLNQ